MKLLFPVVLASGSPRRQELLRGLVEEFTVDRADVDETPVPGETPWQTAERLAALKAAAVFERRPDSLVIGGDTVVALMERGEYALLAKPLDAEDATRMLRRLSGKDHLVITGVALQRPFSTDVFSVTTTVWFRELSDQEIADYVATGEPMDKAGAYAIQGGAKAFVERYEGSLTNVIGFPVEEIGERLRSLA